MEKTAGSFCASFHFLLAKMRKDVLTFVGSLERITGFAGAILSMIADTFPTPHRDFHNIGVMQGFGLI